MSWLLWSLASLASWGTWGILPKLALQGLAWPQLLVFTSISSFVVSLGVVAVMRPSLEIPPSTIPPAIAAGVLGAFGAIFLYVALGAGGRASVVIPLTAAYPVLTAILSVALLREPFDWTKAVAVVLFVAATILAAR